MCAYAAILTSVLALPAASGWLWGLVSALLLNKQQLYFHMDHCHEKNCLSMMVLQIPLGRKGEN